MDKSKTIQELQTKLANITLKAANYQSRAKYHRNDVWTLVPFLQEMKERLGYKYARITADAGYESEEAYTFLENEGQEPYIKP